MLVKCIRQSYCNSPNIWNEPLEHMKLGKGRCTGRELGGAAFREQPPDEAS